MIQYDAMWNLVVFAVMAVWVVCLWWKPSWFLHPRITWHRLVLKHDQEIVPVGFADWDIHCSCGIEGKL